MSVRSICATGASTGVQVVVPLSCTFMILRQPIQPLNYVFNISESYSHDGTYRSSPDSPRSRCAESEPGPFSHTNSVSRLKIAQ